MRGRLSRWGVGPRIAAAAAAYAALGSVASYAWPAFCKVPDLRHPAVTAIAWALIGIGVLLWVVAGAQVMKAYDRDQLVTSGAFALARHPLYSAWIVLILPGLALLSRAWPLLLTPLVAYAVFKSLIHTEDEYLHKRFGRSYLEYRSRVNEILPVPRMRRS